MKKIAENRVGRFENGKAVRGMWPLIYLSGGGAWGYEEHEWLKRVGCSARCFSFIYCAETAFRYSPRFEKALAAAEDHGVHVMMDSGAHTFHVLAKAQAGGKVSQKKYEHSAVDVATLREQTLENYIEYCKERGQGWDFYVTFDWKKHAPTIWSVTEKLEKRGLKPLPVFHGDDTLDWFNRYVDKGHQLMGISVSSFHSELAVKRQYLDRVFNEAEKRGVLLHGFAMTSLSLMLDYPWFSVDSATWIKAGAFGSVVVPDMKRKILNLIHISDRVANKKKAWDRLEPGARKLLEAEVSRAGFSFNKVRTDTYERAIYNAWVFSHIFDDLKSRSDVKQHPIWEALV